MLLPLSYGAGFECLVMTLLNGATMMLWDGGAGDHGPAHMARRASRHHGPTARRHSCARGWRT